MHETTTINQFEQQDAPDPSALGRIFTEAPYFPRCSANKTAAIVRPREFALRYPYMQINREGRVSWLIFDLDHANAWQWEDAGLPAPNLIVRNRSNQHSHLFYAIAPVCTSVKGRAGPIAYMKAIYNAYALRLKADPRYHSGPVAKTPGHPWWNTHELHSAVFDLGDLAKFVELDPIYPKGIDLEKAAGSRHCILFEYLRHFAYAIVNGERLSGTLESFSARLEAYAHAKNSFAREGFTTDLPLSSIRSTVRSVARWTWDHYTGSRTVKRGVMQLDKQLPLEVRQRAAAARTADVRAKASESKVRTACKKLAAAGKAVTQVAVAKLVGMSRQTIATYKHVLAEARAQAARAPSTLAGAAAPTARHVKFAAHQVTGAFPVPGFLAPVAIIDPSEQPGPKVLDG